jgi:phosphoribosylanthranilate isomerase
VSGRIQAKICGLTDPGEAAACAALGADAIGFVFFPKSPRHLTDENARAVAEVLPVNVGRIGVFVDETEAFVLGKVALCGLTGVQLHGRESPEMVERLRARGLTVIKGLFAGREPGFDASVRYRPSAFLVECGKGTLPGGNAETWDWSAARPLGRNRPLVLAGGLTPDNAIEAVREALPDAVDVSSGVEARPGRKDLARVRDFLEALTRAPRKTPSRRIF